MENPDANEVEEQIEQNIEATQEIGEDYYGDDSPTYIKPEDLYSLFWKTIQIKDSSKVGNLDKTELGMLDISVRDCQKIALVARTLGHPKFAEWMDSQAQIILATSSSKRGWLTELFVTAKKFTSREKKQITEFPQIQEKRSFWGKKKWRS